MLTYTMREVLIPSQGLAINLLLGCRPYVLANLRIVLANLLFVRPNRLFDGLQIHLFGGLQIHPYVALPIHLFDFHCYLPFAIPPSFEHTSIYETTLLTARAVRPISQK